MEAIQNITTNHYGVILDNEVPTTGVFSNYSIEIWDEADSGIDPNAEEYEQNCREEWESEHSEEDGEEFDSSDIWDGYEQSIAYIGFREVTEGKDKGLYEVDPDAEYSAIVELQGSFNCTQVLHSQWAIRGALCSPCFPGQVDVDTEGEFLAYSLPPEMIEDEELRGRVFKLPV